MMALVDRLLPLALGQIGLEYDYFMSLTPKLWKLLAKGYQQKEMERTRLFAWSIAHLMNASGNMKKPITIDDLLPKPVKRTKKQEAINFDELKRFVR